MFVLHVSEIIKTRRLPSALQRNVSKLGGGVGSVTCRANGAFTRYRVSISTTDDMELLYTAAIYDLTLNYGKLVNLAQDIVNVFIWTISIGIRLIGTWAFRSCRAT